MKIYRHIQLAAAGGLLLLAGCTHRPYGMSGGNWGHMTGYGYGGIWMWLLVLLLVVAAAYFIFARQKGELPPPAEKETPLDILKKRYARGEISKEEFEQMKADIGER